MTSTITCLALYAIICFVVYRRSKFGLNDPVVVCLIGGGLTAISQLYGSDTIWENYTIDAVVFSVFFCIFVVGLTFIRRVQTSKIPLSNNDRLLAFVTLFIGGLSFVYLVYLVGGPQVYLRRTEEYEVTWEGPIAALAFLNSLAEFSAFLLLSQHAQCIRKKKYLALSLMAILPTAISALLNFRRTALFVLFIYILYYIQLKKGIPIIRRLFLWSLVAVPILTVTVLQGLPYLRTLYFVDIAHREKMSYDHYVSLTKFNETGLGVLLTGTLAKQCGELGFGRYIISETARVFIPKATGIKEPLIDKLKFNDIRNCTPSDVPPVSFFTGLGVAMLDFGYLTPFFLLLCIWLTFNTINLVSNGARSGYIAYLSAYSPLFILYGPVYIWAKIVPIILISTAVKIKFFHKS